MIALLDAPATGNTAHACGCFGSAAPGNAVLSFLAGGNTVTWWDVIRDVILALLAAVVVWWRLGAISVDDARAPRRERSVDEQRSAPQ